jgi:hypothetical protein
MPEQSIFPNFNGRTVTFNGIAIRIRPDGHWDGTAACKADGKLFGDWRRNDRTNALVEKYSLAMGIPIAKLIETKRGGRNQSDVSWLHPWMMRDLAAWLSLDACVFFNRQLDIREEQMPATEWRTGMLGPHATVIDALNEDPLLDDQDDAPPPPQTEDRLAVLAPYLDADNRARDHALLRAPDSIAAQYTLNESTYGWNSTFQFPIQIPTPTPLPSYDDHPTTSAVLTQLDLVQKTLETHTAILGDIDTRQVDHHRLLTYRLDTLATADQCDQIASRLPPHHTSHHPPRPPHRRPAPHGVRVRCTCQKPPTRPRRPLGDPYGCPLHQPPMDLFGGDTPTP